MTSASQQVFFSANMLLAGVGIPIMAALNGGLGARLGNPILAAAVLFGVAFSSIVIVLAFQDNPVTADFSAPPLHFYLGGLLVAFYILSVTWIAPRIGVGNAIVMVVLGQLLAATVIDHFGGFGMPTTPASISRVFGIILMAVGVVLTRRAPGLAD